jgi:DNA-binding cell septation regulator SpoVG
VLSGLKIIKGQFGHFLAFPNQSPGLPFKYYDTRSMSFRKKMQNTVLQEYARALAASVPVSN